MVGTDAIYLAAYIELIVLRATCLFLQYVSCQHAQSPIEHPAQSAVAVLCGMVD